MMTVAEYARHAGMSRQHVHRLVKEGRLPGYKAYGRWMVDDEAVKPVVVEVDPLYEVHYKESLYGEVKVDKPWAYSRVRKAKVSHTCYSCACGIGAGDRYLSWAQSMRWKRSICWPCATLEVNGALRWPCRALDRALASVGI